MSDIDNSQLDAPVETFAKVRVIACGMIAREVLDVKELHNLKYLDLVCLPAQFHYQPDIIAPAMDKAIEEARREGYENIFVGYADCGTGGHLDRVCEKHGVSRIEGPHCFAFYQCMKAFEKIADDDMTSFYMTDFSLPPIRGIFLSNHSDWTAHPQLAADYFGHYEKLGLFGANQRSGTGRYCRGRGGHAWVDLRTPVYGLRRFDECTSRGHHNATNVIYIGDLSGD